MNDSTQQPQRPLSSHLVYNIGNHSHILCTSFAVSSAVGRRAAMEDVFVAMNRLTIDGTHSFYAVYDGHNGIEAADYLSQHLHRNLLKHPLFAGLGVTSSQSAPSDSNGNGVSTGPLTGNNFQVQQALRDAFHVTDADLLRYAQSEVVKIYSGSTAVTLLVHKDSVSNTLRYHCAGCGDSRAVLSYKGRAIDLSKEHRPANEVNRIHAAGGWVHRGRINGVLGVSRSFGDIEYKTLKNEAWESSFTSDLVICDPDVVSGEVDDECEFVVLASDGLFDVMSSQEVVTHIRLCLQRENNLYLASRDIINHALSIGSQDNVTCIIVAFHQHS